MLLGNFCNLWDKKCLISVVNSLLPTFILKDMFNFNKKLVKYTFNVFRGSLWAPC
jgi:hypothetical protein